MRYDQPVGSQQERDAAQAWAGEWFDASGFGSASATYKTLTGSWHTGADLNLPNWKDSRAQVFASADGVVVFVGAASGWQGRLIVIKHADGIWTRYAHLAETRVVQGQNVKRGDWIAIIGDYLPAGGANDHLHWDVARIDLGAKPGDWPGTDLARLLRDYINPLEWINSHREDDKPVAKWTPTSTDGTRVRFSPDTSNTTNIAGVIPSGAVVDGDLSADKQWVQVAIKPERMSVSGVVLAPSSIPTFTGYAAAQFMKPATVTPPPVVDPPKPTGTTPANRLLGLHVIAHHHYAIEAYDKGARMFVWMEGHTGAEEFAAARPDALVLYRKNLGRYHYNAQDLIAAVEGMRSNLPNLLYIGENESDQTGSDGAELEKRLKRDAEVARLRPGKYVMGEFSMGTPRLEDAGVQKMFREIIAPLYNAGQVWLGGHFYTPKKTWVKVEGNTWRQWQGPQDGVPFCLERNGQPCDPIWYPWRWRFLFTHCGFDPKVRKILCGETGADEMGRGGFPAQGTTDAEFEVWCRGYLYLQRLPLTIASGPFAGTYPSPVVGCNLFQRSDFPDWLGYRISDSWLAILSRLYSAPDTREVAPVTFEEWTPRTPPPPYEVPPAKDLSVK